MFVNKHLISRVHISQKVNSVKMRNLWHIIFILGNSQNYMPLILGPSSCNRIATQILVIAKLNGKKDFILRVFLSDIIRPTKELPVQSL